VELHDGSARPRDLYLTTQTLTINIHALTGIFLLLFLYFFVLIVLALPFVLYCTTHTTQTSMPPAGFEPTISASDRPQTLALDHVTTGIGI
jgi:uncharacterized iron-regulated membrane protein